MPRKQEPEAMPLESRCHANSPPVTLSGECKHQLALLVANMIDTHLSSHSALDARIDADRVHSSSVGFKSNNISIKEDCHVHHRSTFD
jgi:hypothetical protein